MDGRDLITREEAVLRGCDRRMIGSRECFMCGKKIGRQRAFGWTIFARFRQQNLLTLKNTGVFADWEIIAEFDSNWWIVYCRTVDEVYTSTCQTRTMKPKQGNEQ